jgi:hypothetical protein
MRNHLLKRAWLFFSSLLIILVHLPFVFAKLAPAKNIQNNAALQLQPVEKVVADKILPGNFTAKRNVYDSLDLEKIGLRKEVFDCAMTGFNNLKQNGRLANDQVISIADLSKSSCKKRLFVIDLKNCKLLFNTYVAHGMNSGQEYARQFSNMPESNKSSLGFYETADTYNGKHGYSLHLVGMERGINDNAYKRDIVIHAADYVNENFISAKGFLGRSQGCPALPEKQHKQIIDKIKNGTCLFIFGEDRNHLRRSALLKTI